jgi:hypothetical protein
MSLKADSKSGCVRCVADRHEQIGLLQYLIEGYRCGLQKFQLVPARCSQGGRMDTRAGLGAPSSGGKACAPRPHGRCQHRSRRIVGAGEHDSRVSRVHLSSQPSAIQELECGVLQPNEPLSSIVLGHRPSDQFRILQGLQVMGEQGHRDVEQGREFLRAAIPEGNVVQEGKSVRVRQHPMQSCAIDPLHYPSLPA